MTKVSPSSSISSAIITNPVHTNALAPGEWLIGKTVSGPWRTLHLPGTTTTWEVSLSKKDNPALIAPQHLDHKNKGGGEVILWERKAPGSWKPIKAVTHHSPRNHAYVRGPDTHPDFAAGPMATPTGSPLPCFTTDREGSGMAIARIWKGRPSSASVLM